MGRRCATSVGEGHDRESGRNVTATRSRQDRRSSPLRLIAAFKPIVRQPVSDTTVAAGMHALAVAEHLNAFTDRAPYLFLIRHHRHATSDPRGFHRLCGTLAR